jgi:hypothetical protein
MESDDNFVPDRGTQRHFAWNTLRKCPRERHSKPFCMKYVKKCPRERHSRTFYMEYDEKMSQREALKDLLNGV